MTEMLSKSMLESERLIWDIEMALLDRAMANNAQKNFKSELVRIETYLWKKVSKIVPEEHRREITSMIYTSFLTSQYSVNRKWITLGILCWRFKRLMKMPIEKMPLYINGDLLEELTSVWRMKYAI
jgi:hypothetical protein